MQLKRTIEEIIKGKGESEIWTKFFYIIEQSKAA